MKRKLIENYTIENKEKLYRIAFSYTKNKERCPRHSSGVSIKSIKICKHT